MARRGPGKAPSPGPDDSDLPRRFYRAATALIGPVWAVNRASDRPPVPSSSRTPIQRLRSSIQQAALKAASTDNCCG